MRRKPTDEQKRKSAERRERFRALVDRLSAMDDAEKIARFGDKPIMRAGEPGAVIRGTTNTALILMQCPTATMVGGFRQWLKLGRCVRRGEHGITIFVPCRRKQDDEPADLDDVPATSTYFTTGTVFDVSQTCELPTNDGDGAAIADDLSVMAAYGTV